MRSIERGIGSLRWSVQRPLLAWRHPDALRFYEDALREGYTPNNSIDLVPKLNILYISNPKVASTRIRAALARLLGNDVETGYDAKENWRAHKRSSTGLKAPRHDISGFYRLAKDPSALRFSFVRHPYDRMVSCWLDQYHGKSLVPGGDVYIDTYLEHREDVSAALPAGASETLSFPQFVEFALATIGTIKPAVAMHWHPQAKILHVPNMELNFIGKIESFAADFAHVLDFAQAGPEIRERLTAPFHSSKRRPMTDYFDARIAARIYSAYEEDFDRYGYSRPVAG